MTNATFHNLLQKMCLRHPLCKGCPLWEPKKRAGGSCGVYVAEHGLAAREIVKGWALELGLLPDNDNPEKAPETRREILEESARLICGDREKDYGDAADNFRTVGLLWSAYLLASHPVLADAFSETSVTAADVAAMLGLLKLARAAANPAHMDNWVDLAGYAALGGEISKKEAE